MAAFFSQHLTLGRLFLKKRDSSLRRLKTLSEIAKTSYLPRGTGSPLNALISKNMARGQLKQVRRILRQLRSRGERILVQTGS